MSRYHLNSARLSIVLLCLWFGIGQVLATSMLLTGVGSSGGGGVVAPAYTLAGTFSSGASGNTISTTMNVGTAAANRIIVIGASSQNSPVLSGATVNSIACTMDVQKGGSGIFSCPGATYGSGVQTIAVTWTSSGFNSRGIAVWIVTNATSSTVVQTGGGTPTPAPVTLSVTAGDLMFSANHNTSASPATYSSSTQLPNNTGTMTANQNYYADWKITASNASFSLTPQTVSNLVDWAAATYH